MASRLSPRERRTIGAAFAMPTRCRADRTRSRLAFSWRRPRSLSTRTGRGDSARVILSRYANAWRGREELAIDRDYVLAFAIKGTQGGNFHVMLSAERGAALRDCVPAEFDIRFDLALEFLRRLDLGEMNARTAMGQARSSDPTPLVPTLGQHSVDAPIPNSCFAGSCFTSRRQTGQKP